PCQHVDRLRPQDEFVGGEIVYSPDAKRLLQSLSIGCRDALQGSNRSVGDFTKPLVFVRSVHALGQAGHGILLPHWTRIYPHIEGSNRSPVPRNIPSNIPSTVANGQLTGGSTRARGCLEGCPVRVVWTLSDTPQGLQLDGFSVHPRRHPHESPQALP